PRGEGSSSKSCKPDLETLSLFPAKAEMPEPDCESPAPIVTNSRTHLLSSRPARMSPSNDPAALVRDCRSRFLQQFFGAAAPPSGPIGHIAPAWFPLARLPSLRTSTRNRCRALHQAASCKFRFVLL